MRGSYQVDFERMWSKKNPKPEKKQFEPESEWYRDPVPLQSSQIVATDSSLILRDSLGPYSMILG